MNILSAGAQSRWLIEAPMLHVHLRLPHELFASAARDCGLDDALFTKSPSVALSTLLVKQFSGRAPVDPPRRVSPRRG